MSCISLHSSFHQKNKLHFGHLRQPTGGLRRMLTSLEKGLKEFEIFSPKLITQKVSSKLIMILLQTEGQTLSFQYWDPTVISLINEHNLLRLQFMSIGLFQDAHSHDLIGSLGHVYNIKLDVNDLVRNLHLTKMKLKITSPSGIFPLCTFQNSVFKF